MKIDKEEKCRICKQIRPRTEIDKDQKCKSMIRCYRHFHFDEFKRQRKEAIS